MQSSCGSSAIFSLHLSAVFLRLCLWVCFSLFQICRNREHTFPVWPCRKELPWDWAFLSCRLRNMSCHLFFLPRLYRIWMFLHGAPSEPPELNRRTFHKLRQAA